MLTATLISTFGLDGTIKALFFSSSGEHIKKGMNISAHLKNGKKTILNVKDIKKSKSKSEMCYMLFDTYDTKEKSASLTGAKLYVKRDDAHPLQNGEVYTADLIGLSLTYNKKRVAEVMYVLEGGSVPFLEVMRDDEKKYIIPYQKYFLGNIDLEKGEIELLNPALIDL